MMNSKKSIVQQIIDFLKKPLVSEKVNRESFQTLEIEIRKGNVDGMRIKEYIKNREEK